MKRYLIIMANMLVLSSTAFGESFNRTYGCDGIGVDCFFFLGRTGDTHKRTPTAPLEKLGTISQAKDKPSFNFPLKGQERWLEFTPTQGQLAGQTVHLLMVSRDLNAEEKERDPQGNSIVLLLKRVPAFDPTNETWIEKGKLVMVIAVN